MSLGPLQEAEMSRQPWWIYDPEKKQIDWTCGIKDRSECALYLWQHYTPPTAVDLKYAIEDAKVDRQTYDAVLGWVRGEGRPFNPLTGKHANTPDSLKPALYDLLHERKTPTAKHVQRNRRIGHIGMVLSTYFEDTQPTRSHTSKPGSKAEKAFSAARIIAELNVVGIEEREIGKIILDYKNSTQ